MRTPFVFLALAATASLETTASTADLFDGPGPGYREQVERFAPQIHPRFRRDLFETSPVLLGTERILFAKPLDDLSLAPASLRQVPFEPTRLFENPFSVAVPFSLVPGTRQ